MQTVSGSIFSGLLEKRKEYSLTIASQTLAYKDLIKIRRIVNKNPPSQAEHLVAFERERLEDAIIDRQTGESARYAVKVRRHQRLYRPCCPQTHVSILIAMKIASTRDVPLSSPSPAPIKATLLPCTACFSGVDCNCERSLRTHFASS